MPHFPYQRVTVTGGAGFLGRHVVARLRALGVEPFVPRRRDFDLVEKGAVARLFDRAQPELMIHLAALVGGIGFNQQNPGRLLHDNLLMGAHIIEEARRRGVSKLVALGTVCAYPRLTPVPFCEDALWNGYPEETNAPYGLAKRLLLAQMQAYHVQYGLRGVYLLPTNLYGPGDNFDPATSHVIPALIRKCVAAQRAGHTVIDVWGTGTASREFLYVEDCADAIVRAAALYDGGEPVNLGSGCEVTIRELVGLIAEQTGYRGAVRWQTDRPDGQPRRWLDTTRAWERFGFRATTPLEDGLQRTVQWYMAQFAS